MKAFLSNIEKRFERFTNATLKIYGSSLAFICALLFVIIFISNKKFYAQSFHEVIRDVILCVTFLSYFLIQKSINKDTTALHLKVNELVAAHEKASNRMVNIENKTEEELRELEMHYADLALNAEKLENIHETQSIENILNKQKDQDIPEKG